MNLTRCRSKALTLPLLLALSGAMLGQGENDPFFSLSSGRTFGTGGKPTLQMTGWNVDSLEFRVYRINDPVRFFQQLDRPHEFGGRGPAPPRNRTILERVRSWKRALRTGIRRSLREQFTESPRAHLDSFLARPRGAVTVPAKGPLATRYAEAPLLNAQQMVMSFTRPVHSPTRWAREEVEVPVNDKGVYLVEAVNHQLRAYTVLFVSDLVMVSKSGKGRILNFVMDRNTGQPVPGIEVKAFDRDNSLPAVRTNAEGVAEIVMPARQKAAEPDNANEMTVLAIRERDVAVNAVYPGNTNPDEWIGYIYTDRPIYRAGHTVHVKAITRLRNTDGYDVPSGRKVNIEVTDADQKPVFQKTVIIPASGSIDWDLNLAPGAPLGNYFIQVKADTKGVGYGGFMSGSFEVQDYRKPEYEVRVTPLKTRVLQGERVQATIDARYFFGEPVNGAKVKYSVYRSQWRFPLWYDPDDDETGFQDDGGNVDYAGDQITDQEGQLDANGKLNIEVPTAISEHGIDFVYRVEARVTDAANREISGAAHIVATYGSFALNVTPDRYVYEPGSHASLTVRALDFDYQPVRTHVHLEFEKWTPRYRVTDHDTTEAVSAADAETDANGQAKAVFVIPSTGGSYRVRATARTPQGREVSSLSYLWVPGGTWASAMGQRRNIEIIPDKKSYSPGDTAKLLIVTGQPGVAVYATIEGRDIRLNKLIRAQDSTVSFEVPIDAKYEPGITVQAMFIRDGVAWNGTKYLRVPPAQHELNVKLSTDKPQYLPGETADYSLEVTDKAGQPVPRAELTLGVVDEAIYGIRPDITPNMLNFFFGHDYNRVLTQTSLEYFFSGQAGKNRMQLADLRPRSRLAQLKPERLVQPKVRKAFPDTAFWAPALVTDASGHVHAKVEFPDSLTTWRATARGITAATSVGAATLKTIVRKNLILRLTTPRFLVQGDEITISALVHNYLPTAKTARVSLDVKGLEIIPGKTQDVQVPSRGEAKVDWRIRPQRTRTVTITGKALTDEESDALEISLPVNFAGIKLSSSKGGSVKAGDSADFDMTFPEKAGPGSRLLSVRVAPTIAGSLFAALDYLTSFPYGCVEQTMSGFLPDIIVKDAVKTLGLKTDLNEAALQEKIRAGLDRLYSFQHQDGGWGWWETDDSHPFMTAYVVAGLVQARATGTTVNDAAIRRGVNWLKKDLVADQRLTADFRAYLIYALTLAGQIDNTELSALFDRRSELTSYGMAILGLALENAKDARAAQLAAALEANARQDGEQAWWPAKRDPMLDFDTDATPEATAYVAKFLSHQKKESALLPKAAAWLIDHRNEGYWWSSTKQTAMVIYGLVDYLKVTKELMPNLTATIFVNGNVALTRKLDQATLLNSPDLVLDEGQLRTGNNHIRVVTSGEGRLYYGARAEYYSTEPHLERSGTTSLNLLRDYFRLVPDKTGDRVVYDTVPLTGPVTPGDTIAVRLTVTGSEWKYLMLEDPIPAGTEFIERDNLYELRNRPPWWQWYFDRREMHDDHMAIFQTDFVQGQRQYFYLLKVVNSGVFQANPARVGPMYQNDIFATTESRRLEVH